MSTAARSGDSDWPQKLCQLLFWRVLCAFISASFLDCCYDLFDCGSRSSGFKDVLGIFLVLIGTSTCPVILVILSQEVMHSVASVPQKVSNTKICWGTKGSREELSETLRLISVPCPLEENLLLYVSEIQVGNMWVFCNPMTYQEFIGFWQSSAQMSSSNFTAELWWWL